MDLKTFPFSDHIRVLTVMLPGFEDLICSNMYIVGTGPITLIDTAPKFPGSFLDLQEQLNGFGFDWGDVERIIITHGHIDHFGLVGEIRRASGHAVPCHVHEEDLWRLSGDYLRGGMWSAEADVFYAKADIPAKTVQRMKRRSHFFKNLCDPIDDAISMKDGDIFTGSGFELRVVHTPGHSPGCCCIYEARSSVLFSGDHILKHITPNPFHEVNRSRLKDKSYRSLAAYMDSLERIERLEVSAVYPAHGGHLTDLSALLAGYRQHHRDRSERILQVLGDSGRSLYAIMQEVFPDIEESVVFLAVSEILVHLEMLIEAGRAECADEGPPALYRAVLTR